MSLPRLSNFLALGFAALLLLSVAGCGEGQDPFASSDYDVPAPIYVGMADVPPPLTSDEIHRAPNPRNEIWRPGHWNYEDGQFVWVAGIMMSRPSPTAVWSGDRWERRQYGWVFIPGYWQ